MKSTPESSKLKELRAKTDRQLVQFITSRLDVGLNYARLVADPESRRNWASTDAFRAGAEKAYDEARELLPWVQDVTKAERRLLEIKVRKLRELLDEFSSPTGLRVQTACS